MEEKQICCCGSGGWTRAIAYLQMFSAVSSSYSVTLAVGGAIAMLSMDVENAQHPDGTRLTLEEIQAYKTAGDEEDDLKAKEFTGITSLLVSIIILLYTILNCVMGFVLLRGSTNRNPRQIHYWIVYTVICIAIWLVRAIFECYLYSGIYSASEVVPIFLGIIALVLAVLGFFLWVVAIHKKEIEIEASTEPVLPVRAYRSKEEEVF